MRTRLTAISALAAPGGGQEDGVLAGVQEAGLAEVLDDGLLRALEGELQLLKALRAGKHGALIRPSPPWLLREDTSRQERLGEAL